MATEPLADWEKELLGSRDEDYEATLTRLREEERASLLIEESKKWKPINNCSLLHPHTNEGEPWMNDEMNEAHLDPKVPFKTDWDQLSWDVIRQFNKLY